MDIKKLSQFIIILGILILAVGAFKWVSNQPKTFVPTAATPGQNVTDAIGLSMQNSTASMQVGDYNSYAAQARGVATHIMIAGAIVIFIGVGISASAKKSSP